MTPTSPLAMTPSGLALHFGQELLGRAQGLAAVRPRPQAFLSLAGLRVPVAGVGAPSRRSVRSKRLRRSSRNGGQGRWDVRRAKAWGRGL